MNNIRKIFRSIRVIKNRLKLKNKDFTIISSNCIGGVLYKEFGQKFMSPTINLYILPNDFIKFVKNLKLYLNKELLFIDDHHVKFPVAYLGDIKIYFMHYETKEEANRKWNERIQRINYDNIFIIMMDKDGCTNRDIERFEELPYKNKVIFTNNNIKQYETCVYISGFEKKKELGNVMDYCNIFGKKYYDDFNFVKWFNNENI